MSDDEMEVKKKTFDKPEEKKQGTPPPDEQKEKTKMSMSPDKKFKSTENNRDDDEDMQIGTKTFNLDVAKVGRQNNKSVSAQVKKEPVTSGQQKKEKQPE